MRILKKTEKLKQVDPDDVEIGTEIVIKAGERVPLDGVVVSGTSFVDTSALTGESVPREVTEGSEIISGCVNGSGLLKVRTTKSLMILQLRRFWNWLKMPAAKRHM